MEKLELTLTKTALRTINQLSEKTKVNVLQQLKLIESSSNPLDYGYGTVNNKIGDIIFKLSNLYALAKIKKNYIYIFFLTE